MFNNNNEYTYLYIYIFILHLFDRLPICQYNKIKILSYTRIMMEFLKDRILNK